MLRTVVVAVLASFVLAAPAVAAGLTATQTVEVATLSLDANGNTVKTFAPAEEIAPGDELRYVLNFANDGEAPATNVRLDMPVPDAVTLIDGTVESGAATVTYSTDNGRTFAARTALTVQDAAAVRPATAEDITHIRWSFDQAIAPGSSGAIGYGGRLN